MTEAINVTNHLNLANDMVNNLYNYRDNYFVIKGLENGASKDSDVSIKMNVNCDFLFVILSRSLSSNLLFFCISI